MFFRMLKSDIRVNKGLNFILFIFITVASVIVFTGGGLLYSNVTENQRTEQVSAPSDIFIILETDKDQEPQGGENQESLPENDITPKEMEERKQKVRQLLTQHEGVREPVFSDIIYIPGESVYSDALEGSLTKEYMYYNYFFTEMPEKYDKLYNEFDEPFTVESGKIGLPIYMKRNLGLKMGDVLSIETQDGDIFRFEISDFYKDPFFSPYELEFIVVSHEDYEELYERFPKKMLFFRTEMESDNDDMLNEQMNDMMAKLERLEGADVYGIARNGSYNMGEDAILSFIISVFISVIVVFLILIIFMIVRFTMISDLKKEEKEIGVIKAIGSDTPGFRWLFAAKYCAFALVGSVVASITGVPLFYKVSRMVNKNTVMPKRFEVEIAGSLMVLFLMIVIIVFAFFMMKRINRISVVDALQGENHGERFGKSSVMYLYKSKKMPTSLFYVLSDILKRFRRYLFLIVAYTLGMSIMLLCFNLRNTVISSEFLKYMNVEQIDFWFEINLNDSKQLMNEAKDDENIIDVLNRKIEENGIPAYINTAKVTKGKLELNNNGRDYQLSYQVLYDFDRSEEFTLREGVMPKLENEVVLNYYFANEAGLKVGDIVDFSILEPSKDSPTDAEDGTWMKKKLVITGFRDCMESGGTVALMGEDYTQEHTQYSTIISARIYSDKKDKVIKQLKELFPTYNITNGNETARRTMKEFDIMFEQIEYSIGGAVLFVCALMTYLFETIFITEERSEIALMKSLGFTEGRLKLLQLLRIALLTLISQVLALLLFKTAGVLLLRGLFGYLYLSGFTFLNEYLYTLLIIPFMLFGVVMAMVLLKLGSIDKISIRDITEE